MNRSELASSGTSTAHVADWREEAACRDEDPELFFPIGNTGHALVQIDEAKAVCRRCEVVDTCLRWALDTGQDAGVWGNLSEDERRALKRRNARDRVRSTRPPRTAADHAARGLVPAVNTHDVITACRAANTPWREIGKLLGTSDATCREVYGGTRNYVVRATEEAASALLGLVSAQ